jgi:type IV pilus assembly protein PilN
MIKINLLPKAKQERKAINLDLYVFVATLVVAIALVGGVYFKNASDIEKTRADIESLKQQIKVLEPIQKEYVALEKDKSEIARKLTVISKMKEGRALPPRMLSDLSSLMKDNLWLKRLRKDDVKIEIEGRSVDNESICDFVDHLAKLPYLKNLELRSVEDVSEGAITVKKFVVDGSVSL